MKRINVWLVAILALQLALAAGLMDYRHQAAADSAPAPLLALERSRVDRITLDDDQGHSTELVRQDGRWQLPGYHGLPVRNGAVDDLLEKLAALRVNWPEATTASAQRRFEVAEDKYQRKLRFFAGDQPLGTLFLGTSPGFRQVHARRGGDDATFAVALNTYEVPARAKEWFDRGLLLPEPLTLIRGNGFELHKSGEAWQAGDGVTVEQPEAQRLAEALAQLRVEEALPKPATEPPPAATLEAGSDQQNWQYRFYHQGTDYFVERGDKPLRFRITKQQFDGLALPEGEKLIHPAATTG